MLSDKRLKFRVDVLSRAELAEYEEHQLAFNSIKEVAIFMQPSGMFFSLFLLL